MTYQLQSHTDRLIRMIDKELIRIGARAARDATVARQQIAVRALGTLADIRAVAEDLDQSPDARLLMIQERLSAFSAIDPMHLRSRASLQRYLLATRRTAIPKLLASLSELSLVSSTEAALLQASDSVARTTPEHASDVPETTKAAIPRPWKPMVAVGGPEGLRAAQAAIAFEIRKALRRGSIACPASVAYRDRSEVLECGRTLLAQRSRSVDVDRFLDSLSAHLAGGLAAISDAIAFGEVAIRDGAIRLRALDAENQHPDDHGLRDVVARSLDRTTLADILVQIDAATRFSSSLLGRPPASEAELRYVYAGLVGHGTELTPARLALMIPGTDAEGIGAAMLLCEDGASIRQANEAVVSFLRSHPVVSVWGRGTECAADMMSLDVSRHVWAARTDPRRRTWAIGAYSHVLDQWCVIHDQPIVLNQRQAGAAIEGLLGHREIRPERVAVDTHGYTYLAFAVAKLLGFDLCPRLRNLKERVLWLPTGFPVPEELKSVSRPTVSLERIRRGWSDLEQLAEAIRGGEISATLALERFGSAARGHPAYEAGVTLGKLLRTLYLCDYFSNRPFRREILRLINHGEALHSLQRQIHAGTIAPLQGRSEAEQIGISGSLALLTNAVLAWNTHRIQHAVDAYRAQYATKPPGPLVRQISPARHAHINFRGTIVFPIEKFAERLFQGPMSKDPNTGGFASAAQH